MHKPVTYLKGLHGLRFFCAILVVIYHCNDAISQIDPHLRSHLFIFQKGSKAVDFFFILSGFLITFLALSEIAQKGTIDIKRFFIKRITRIFPLYYLAVFLGFLLIGVLYPRIYGNEIFEFSVSEGLFKYLFFLPNLMASEYGEVGPLRSLWSIGVEEQFYLLFPLLILGVSSRNLPLKRILLSLIVFSVLYATIYYKLFETNKVMYTFFTKYFRFHFILLGCLGGTYFYRARNQISQSILRNRITQLLIWITFILLMFSPNSYDVHNLAGGILFLVIIFSLSADISLISLESKTLTYLGIISYGIYIFHPYVSICLRFLMQRIGTLKEILTFHSTLFHVAVIMITILVSGISYKYYESFFLRLRK